MSRLIPITLLATLVQAAPLPPDFAAACANFRAENPRGWSFTQTTTAEGRTLVERCDAARPEFSRWSLLAQDGRPPSPQETANYNEMRSRRSRGGTAPHIASQLDLASAELVSQSATESVYRFKLLRESSGDRTAGHLRATLTFHHPTGTIRRFELSNQEPFSPVLGVRIREMHTSIHYHLPEDGRPALLEKILTRTRGRAYFKSLDADMEVTFTDYAPARGPSRAGGDPPRKAD
jgi:hypothetical protein